ncbi:hypothetical protein ONZ45_g11668 [Pleurotus djamor]|nr:hypothetical protein ONZ45_g11668 [Pleurotus djamor]
MSTSFPRDGGDGEVWHAEESDRIHARRLARSTVYGMRHSTVGRCWGTFTLLEWDASTEYFTRQGYGLPVTARADIDLNGRIDDLDLSQISYDEHSPSEHAYCSQITAGFLFCEWSYDYGSGLHAGAEGSASGGYGNIEGVELVTALKRLDLLRMGGAPGFWECGLRGFSADQLAPENEVQSRGGARMGLGVEGNWMRMMS